MDPVRETLVRCMAQSNLAAKDCGNRDITDLIDKMRSLLNQYDLQKRSLLLGTDEDRIKAAEWLAAHDKLDQTFENNTKSILWLKNING